MLIEPIRFFCYYFFVLYYYYNRVLMLIYKVGINVRDFFSKRKYSIIFCHHTVFIDNTIKKQEKIKCDSNCSQQRKILVSPSLPSVLHLQTVPDRDTLLINIATQRGRVTNSSVCFAPAGSLQKPAVRLWT